MRSGWGYTLAKVLAKEATRSYLRVLDCSVSALAQALYRHPLQVDAA